MSIAQQQPIDIKAAAWTVGVHILLLLLFFFIKYTSPDIQPVEEMGMEVNLGTSLDGYGTDQPMALGEPAPDNESANSQAAANTTLPANIVESNDPDAPAVATTETKKTSTSNNTVNSNTRTNTNRPANNATTQQRARYVYGGSKGTGGNNATADVKGGSEGNTSGTGDRGVPGGTPGAPNYEGTPGSGNGISHNISGRSIVAFPPKEAEFKEGGNVTVRITVNRAGDITDKRILSSPNKQLSDIALKKVSSIRFNKSDKSPEEQFGNITFVFKTRS